MADAVALIVKGGQRQPEVQEDDQEQRQVDDEPAQFVAQTTLRNPSSRHGCQGHQAIWDWRKYFCSYDGLCSPSASVEELSL